MKCINSSKKKIHYYNKFTGKWILTFKQSKKNLEFDKYDILGIFINRFYEYEIHNLDNYEVGMINW